MQLKRPSYFLIFSIVPLVLILQRPIITETIHNASLTILKPFMVMTDGAATVMTQSRDTFATFWDAFHNQSAYEGRILELESKLDQYEKAVSENLRLRKLLQFQDNVEEKAIAARVIGWDLSPWRRTAVLDKGLGQGIKKDMAVVVLDGFVGRVLEVGPATSRVLLIVDPEGRAAAISSDSRAQGVVAGTGSTKLKMKYLDLESGVKVGETVRTSGLTGLFPKGIRIGVVEAVGRDSDGLHLVAEIRPFVSFAKLEEVLCIVSSQPAS